MSDQVAVVGERRYYFDKAAADVAVLFFETLLVHSKGEWFGQPFKLQPWQKKIVRDVFGWKREDGTRRYRTVYIEVPRKNGKSTFCSGLALYLLFADGEPGAEVYSAAVDREQANIVFEEAKKMVEASPDLLELAEPYKKSIMLKSGNGVYRVLSGDAPNQHGLNASGIVFDELHAQPNRELYDVLTTSTGARRQPLMIMITTAGFDRESICYEQHEHARKVLDGIVVDPEFYAFIAAADDKDDWMDPATWRKANPGYGVTIKEDYLATEARRAATTPAYQNTFRRLHLNQWTSQETRWLDIGVWDGCAEPPIDEQLLKGQICYGGLDLASTTDIAAFVLNFSAEPGEDEQHVWLPFFWIPSANLQERVRRDRVPYDAWVRDGWMRMTEGNVIDYNVIVRDIIALGEQFNIKEIAFDRWGATLVSQQLEGAGFTMVGFGQGFQSMSGPTKELLRIVLDKRLRHGGNPVLRWMADNLVVRTDPAGNVKPDKEKSREKIDGIVAGIMGLDRALRNASKPVKSVYETRGIRFL